MEYLKSDRNRQQSKVVEMQHDLANLLVNFNKFIHQTNGLVRSLNSLVQDLWKASVGSYDNQLGYASMEDAATFYLKRMTDEFLPEIRSSGQEIMACLTSLEQIVNSMCILETQPAPRADTLEAVKSFLTLSTEFTGQKVEIEKLQCDAKLKNALIQPLNLHGQLRLKYSSIKKLERSVESAKTFAVLMIPSIGTAQERKIFIRDQSHHPRMQCVECFKDALQALQLTCVEYLKLK